MVVTDLGGGLLAVASGVNTWAEAWGSKALLAAPVPMIAVQVVLAVVACRKNGRGAAVAAGLLGVACFVSVISGFFDGGIGNDELTPALSAYQMFLLAVTAVVGVLAAIRAREAWPGETGRQWEGVRPASGAASPFTSASCGLSSYRLKDARTSASASVRPTQLAPSTDLPGSRSL